MIGFVFGSKFGAFLGALTMFINGFLSPWGFAGLIMPFQVIGMVIIGFVGGIYNRSLKGNPYSSYLTCVEVAILAAFLTLIYDLITNVGFAVLFEVNIIAALIMGAWFTIIHVGSNTIIFGSTFVPLAKIVKRLEGGEAFC